jgi:hypothetical protein
MCFAGTTQHLIALFNLSHQISVNGKSKAMTMRNRYSQITRLSFHP